jgi:hypothetical protein
VNTDDLVIFSAEHYDWLLRAERWPNAHVDRHQYLGRVIATGDCWTRVLWDARSEPTTHFTSNLDRVTP